MATRPFPADSGVDDVADEVARLNHHRLTVLAASPADVVQLAGGWLFDQARAGWDVNVWVAGAEDRRPLTILGAGAISGDRDAVLSDVAADGAVAITAELLRLHAGVRAWVLGAAKRPGAKITVLGEWPAALGGPIDPVHHQCSVAAQAFKARAMAAAGSVDEATAGEKLFEVSANVLRPLYRV